MSPCLILKHNLISNAVYHATHFEQLLSRIFAFCNAPEGTLIGKITLETNLSYRLNGHNQFVSVDIQTGEIRTSASLDRETITPNGTIILFLTAEQERIITVRINVLDINDNSPTFPSRFLEVSIVESAVIGGRIRLQPASDPDLAENGTIVNYELKDEKEFFALVRSSNSTGGDVLLLELLAKLDRETKDLFVLNISAYDGGNPPRTGHCVVYVNVLDANDNPPTFRQSRYDVQLNESVQPDVVVLRVEATDADVGDNGRITYRFASNLSKHFQVDPDTGAISVQASGLDCPREDCLQNCGGMCVLAVEAEDHGDPKLVGHTLIAFTFKVILSSFAKLWIFCRTYPTGSKFASVSSETAVGSTVAVITTNDEDAGQNVRLSLVDGNNENYFRLENGKNYGILRQNRLVDKPIEQFLLKFRATDDGVPPRFCERTLTVSILRIMYVKRFEIRDDALKDVTSSAECSARRFDALMKLVGFQIFVLKLNDTAPILREKLLKVDIMENAAAGSFVAAIQALAEGELHFSIIENSANDELFSVGNKTGIVTLSQTWPNHTKWNYKVEVMIRKAAPSDKFSICIIQVAIIDVNDHEPQFSFPFYEIEVSEDAPPLSVIFKVTATDKDHGNNSVISYNMESSVKRHLFMVKESSGEVLLRKKLDRETEKQHKISITAVDHGTPSRSSTALLIINVLDVNDNDPYFAQLEYHGYIIRGDPAGTHLVQLEAFDDDSHQFSQISYLLYHTAPSFLELDHATGRMNLAVHADLLDFGQKIKVTVGAKDNGGRLSRNNATVHIWLLDSVRQIPQFNAANNWSIEINENSFPEKVLASFSVYPAAENIRYRINTTDLLIDEFTGHVRARRSFDREVEPRIGFTVYADGEWSTGMRQGTLKILDQNDNSPICELDGAVHFIIDARERDIGRELFRLSCYDPDDGPNGLVTYSINSNFFGIDSEIGIIRLLKFPDGLNQLQFHVTATDGGEQPRHSTIKVVVEIKGDESIYTFPPVITLCIPEDVPLGTILTNLTPKNTTQHFEFRTSANAENYPIQVLPSGEVFVASMIDYEILNHLSISVTAFNLEKKSISNKHDFLLQLYVEDINDNVPQCPLNSKFLIPENNIPGAIVGFFNAFDNDSGPNGTLFYELTYDSEKTFSIDPHIGIIRALSVLDFELAQFHNVTVIVTDGGLLRTECIVVVEVIDSNDNEPHWEQEYHHFYASSSIEDSFVGKVKAADLDSVLNGEVRYKLQQKWLPFKIDEISGILTRNGSLAPNHVYNITIIATDRGTPPLSSATFVFVHTAAEDDCIPNFINYPRTDIEIDNSLFGKVITQVHAVACGAEVLYSLSYGDSHYGSHTNFVLFWIDSIDGSIFLTEVIDAHIGQRLELIVKAETTSTSNNLTFGVVVIEKRNEKSGADANTIHIKENNNVNKVCAKIEAFGNSLQLLRQIPRGKTFHFEGQDLVCDEVLDREKVSSYRLVVAGSNDSMKKIISVQVDDENDNFPECFGTKAILVGSESSFIPWNCFDKDAGLNGTIGYKVVKNAEIVSEINDNGFTVSPFTGDLQHFSVLVYDRNDGVGYRDNDKLQKSIELHFILIPVNMGLRKQIEFQEQYRIDQDIQPGTVFGTIAAETGAVVEYFITSFKNEQHMDSIQWADVDRQTGQLRVNRRPDCGLANMEITILSEGFTKTITVVAFACEYEFAMTSAHLSDRFMLSCCSVMKQNLLILSFDLFVHFDHSGSFIRCREPI
uniref:Cadherin domain-containing protein n=1 Tax=Setaria digitata TaxID=48799 RepID=A0A915PHT5_9BILA